MQLWITSASERNTFCYDKTIELLEQAIIFPDLTFCWGIDYKVPVQAGLLSADFLTEMKLESTFSEAGFAKEYMSRFVGSSSESWFDYEKLESRRRLVNPEMKSVVREGVKSFYILAVDIARRGC